ncbi:unnamed protein product [Ectocarpus sp. 12 AP-2014]
MWPNQAKKKELDVHEGCTLTHGLNQISKATCQELKTISWVYSVQAPKWIVCKLAFVVVVASSLSLVLPSIPLSPPIASIPREKNRCCTHVMYLCRDYHE